MTEISEIINRCQQLGIRLSLGLRVEGWSKAPADLQDAIRLHKEEFLCLLRSQSNEEGMSTVEATTKASPWGTPIADASDPTDPVLQRHPTECDCFRAGVLRCGVPCVWAWPPGAKAGDKALPLLAPEQRSNDQ